MAEYNGWANYETWNVALWLQNDYPLYCITREFASWPQPYRQLRQELRQSNVKYLETGDGVSLWDACLDINALDEMIRDC